MSDHLVVFVDRLIRPVAVQSAAESSEIAGSGPVGGGADGGPGLAPVPAPNAAGPGPSSSATDEKEDEGLGEEKPLIQTAECRICQEEDSLKDLETPCACSGSLKYAHRKCVQHWCNEKGDTICEICHQPYQPGYTAPPPSPPDETAIDIGGGWTISGTPLELDPRLLAIAEAERHFLEAEYDDYAASSASGAAYCRSVALILMALLLLRHALGISDPDADTDDETSAFFSLFLLRAAGFLLPCYIMAWAISMLQRRRQRQEAAALAATQVAFVLQSGQRRGLQFAMASGRAAAVPAPAPSGPAPTVASPQEAV